MYNDLFSVGPLTVHTYGLCIGIGIAAALLLIWCRAERRGMDTQDVNRLVLLVLVTGFAGAKLFYLFAHMDEFLSDPLGTLGAEGFVVYGGIVCGLLAAYLFCRKRSLPFSAWADGFIPGVAVAQGFGRIGCFFAGCCFGAGRSRRRVPRGQSRPGWRAACSGAAFFRGGGFSARRALAAARPEKAPCRASHGAVSAALQHRSVSHRISALRPPRRSRCALHIAVHRAFHRRRCHRPSDFTKERKNAWIKPNGKAQSWAGAYGRAC